MNSKKLNVNWNDIYSEANDSFQTILKKIGHFKFDQPQTKTIKKTLSDGSKYFGEIKDDLPNGLGVLVGETI